MNPHQRVFNQADQLKNELKDIKSAVFMERNGYQELDHNIKADNINKAKPNQAEGKFVTSLVKKDIFKSRSRNSIGGYSSYYTKMHTQVNGKPPLPG